ncbi:MAG TPA: lysylphosphatidylglycerol synthase domain-containing protein [Solirubrobacter sp.]|nr:lysylphosphatidylglycerol synthase domain-containing protein [Solirubrobacter sp.]
MKWINLAVTAATLAFLVWHVGAGAFLDGLEAVNAEALAAAFALAALTTGCCAWRWRIVARGLGDELPLGTAVAAYYRSIFLNLAFPGGIVGDVHRGINHGLRAVVTERLAGQVVQLVLTVAVLAVVASPVQPVMPFVALALIVIAVLARRRLAITRDRAAIALASALVVAGHAATFLIAARAAGATAPVADLVPLALLVLAAAALPNVGGWGPREGMAAWAFAAAGMGASLGVATGVVYGVMVLFASLPGAVVLLATTATWREAAPHG